MTDGITPDEVERLEEEAAKRRFLEQSLRESQERLQDLYENAPVAYFSVSGDGLITRCNRQVGELLRCAPGDLVMSPLIEIFADTPDGKEKASRVLEGLLAGERASAEEMRIGRSDGTTVWVSLAAATARNSGVKALESLVMAVDVSERKNLSREIRRLASIVESARDAIIGLDMDGIIESWNPGAEKTYGYSAAEMLGSHFSVLVSPEWSRDVHTILEAIRNGDPVDQFETVRIRKDGKRIDVSIALSPIRDEAGRIVGASAIVRDITERKRADEALEKWSRIFKHAGWGIAVASAGGSRKLEMMNPAFARMHGHTIEELTDRPIGDLVAPGNELESAKRLALALKLGHFTFESRHRRLNGSVFPVLADVTAVRDESGQAAYLVINIQDITERKRAEEALRRSEAGLKEAQRIARFGNWDWNIQTDEMRCSDEAHRIFGLQSLKINMNSLLFLESVHPEDREFVASNVRKALDGVKPYDVKYRIAIPSGSERVIHAQGEVRRDKSGKPVGMVGTIQDITEREETEREMLKLSMAVEHAYDWILMTDAQGVIQYANEAVEKMSGYSRAELLGRKPSIFKSGKYDKNFYRNMWSTILSGQVLQTIMINRKKNGELFEAYHTITPLRDNRGNISHFIATSKDMTQQKLLEQRVAALAYFDVLTDLPNRNLFLDRLSQTIAAAQHGKTRIALLSLDIDRFTFINDTFGFDKGDEVLKEVGRRLQCQVGAGELAARFGSDEFGIILADPSNDRDVLVVVERIREAFQHRIKAGDDDISITLSIGISLYPNDGDDAHSLLKNAEIAMAKSKAGGMNDYQFYTPDMNARASEFVRMQKGLQDALKNGEFGIHYQPYFESGTKKMAGMEALLRWNGRELGPIPPSRFIPILEETGMIVDVGAWTLETVCRQLVEWQNLGYPVVPVAVNLSSIQFRQNDLAAMVERTIEKTGMDPRLLTFEITESTFMRDVESTRKVLAGLKAMGLTIAIDDFGTGHSSLSYLMRFPVDILKIDRSFVRDLATDPDSASIVTGIIALAHNMNLKTIAEGVETEEQLRILRILRCDIIQGFHLSRPAPATDIEKMFKTVGSV